MAIRWSDFALRSLEEIIRYYETEAGLAVADAVEKRIFDQIEKLDRFPMSIAENDIFPGARKLVFTNLPYVVFIRLISANTRELVDIVHTSRKLPKNS